MLGVLELLAHGLGEDAGKEPGADAFDEVALAPGSGHQPDIELDRPRLLPSTHDVLEGLVDEPERARDVVGGAGGQHPNGNAPPGHAARHLADSAVAAGDGDEIGGFLQRALPAVLLRRAIAHVVAVPLEEPAELACFLGTAIAGAGVVDECYAHATCWLNVNAHPCHKRRRRL